MAIQQYDYTACCTGFLQQLPPSFWGISTGNGRTIVLSKYRQKKAGGGVGKESRRGLQQRGPSVLAVGPDAHNTHRQGEARARMGTRCDETREEKEKETRKRTVSLSLSLLPSAPQNALQKLERRAVRKMPYYLVPSNRSLSEEQNWLPFQASLEKRREGESLGWRSGFLLSPPSVLSSCPSYIAFFVTLGVKPSLAPPSLFHRIFPDTGVQLLRRRRMGRFICSLCAWRSHRFERIGQRRQTKIMRASDETRGRFAFVVHQFSCCVDCRKQRAQMYTRIHMCVYVCAGAHICCVASPYADNILKRLHFKPCILSSLD